MKREKQIIRNNKKEKLVGYLYKNTSKTLLILCHGVEPFSGYPDIEEVFELYHSTGASVFAFDFSGYGESEGKKTISFRQRDADIKSVLDYFSPHYKDIILYGASLAGISAAIAAGSYKEITKLITINGLFTFNPKNSYVSTVTTLVTYLLLHPYFWSEFYWGIKNLKIQNIKVPTLVVCGEKDTIINSQQSINFYNALKTKKRLIAVRNGDHALMKKEYLDLRKELPDWISQQVVYM